MSVRRVKHLRGHRSLHHAPANVFYPAGHTRNIYPTFMSRKFTSNKLKGLEIRQIEPSICPNYKSEIRSPTNPRLIIKRGHIFEVPELSNIKYDLLLRA